MKHGSLFSGIGGFDLAAEWMGWENVFQVEWDKFCQKVLAKNFPNVKRYGDIKEFDGTEWKGRIDIISGGFPCQPFSQAGNRKGTKDDRYLWPEYLRVIREIKPSYVVGENVPGIIDMELDNIITDLENEGYTTEQFIIPACAVGAPHRRDRVWIIAYTFNNTDRTQRGQISETKNLQGINREALYPGLSGRTDKSIANTRLLGQALSEEQTTGNKQHDKKTLTNGDSEYSKEYIRRNKLRQKGREVAPGRSLYEPLWDRNWIEVASEVCRVDDGVPAKLDRIKSLGNAIVPQIAFQLFKAIEQYEKIIPD